VEPTRDKATLVLVLCNEARLISNTIVKDALGNSDHKYILQSQTKMLNINKAKYIGMMGES